MPRDRSFWHYLFERQGVLNKLPEDAVALQRTWRPERSNCPELTEVIEDLIHKVPGEWRALAGNLFVGRVLDDGEANASAWTKVKAGVIEINLQYTWVVSAYVAAFDDYAQTVGNLLQAILAPGEDKDEVVRALDDRLSKRRLWLDESRLDWLDLRLLSAGNPAFLQSAPPGRIKMRENAVGACEEFVIAHELAHHLLWHTVSKSGKSKAWQTVDAATKDAGITEMMIKQNASQLQELHADILAFMMTANAINGTPSFNDLYRSLAGSMISYIALADINESWIEKEADASHPDFMARCELIAALVEWLSKSRPASDNGDHPLGLLVQLQGFCGISINAWLNRGFPDKVNRVSILDIVDHLLKLSLEAQKKIPPSL
jgi:hypothetical protein